MHTAGKQEAAVSAPEETTIDSTRFGRLIVAEDAVVTFPSGLLGFANARRFVAVPQRPQSPFVWLQSLEHPDLAFLLADPLFAFADYAEALLSEFGAGVSVWVLVTVPPGNPEQMTANLLGPIVIDTTVRTGHQLVLADDRFTTKHRVFAHAAREPEPVFAGVDEG